MQDREKTIREVIEIVAEIADLPVEEVGPDATLEELGIDSLNGLRIVAAVEKRFGVNIPDEEIGKIRTMPQIFALVDTHPPEE